MRSPRNHSKIMPPPVRNRNHENACFAVSGKWAHLKHACFTVSRPCDFWCSENCKHYRTRGFLIATFIEILGWMTGGPINQSIYLSIYPSSGAKIKPLLGPQLLFEKNLIATAAVGAFWSSFYLRLYKNQGFCLLFGKMGLVHHGLS